MRLSVLIPTLDEADELPGCLSSVRAQDPPADEILVSDGGSSDGTLEIARGCGEVVVLTGPAGRGGQLNRAAQRATGDALLFLHADTHLPAGALGAVRACLNEARHSGGAFHKVFRDRPRLNRGVRWRTRTWHFFGAAFGDQALFVRREDFLELGGFREDLLAEDAELVRRLRRRGRFALLDLSVATSARRLDREGTWRTWSRWWSVWARELRAGRRDGRDESRAS